MGCESSGGFRITPEWLREVNACRAGRAFVAWPMTVRDAFATALIAGHPDWCVWGTIRLLRLVPTRDQVQFACRCARRVQHLWPNDGRDACENAVVLAERFAAGEHIARKDLWVAKERANEVARVAGYHDWGVGSAGLAPKCAAWAASAAINAHAAWICVEDSADAAADSADATGPAALKAAWLEIADDLQRMMDAKESKSCCEEV